MKFRRGSRQGNKGKMCVKSSEKFSNWSVFNNGTSWIVYAHRSNNNKKKSLYINLYFTYFFFLHFCFACIPANRSLKIVLLSVIARCNCLLTSDNISCFMKQSTCLSPPSSSYVMHEFIRLGLFQTKWSLKIETETQMMKLMAKKKYFFFFTIISYNDDDDDEHKKWLFMTTKRKICQKAMIMCDARKLLLAF